jgi:signal transduction histidine kinase
MSFVSAAFGRDFLTPEERDWLAAHPVIKVAPDPDFPPYEFFDADGNYQGVGADYLALIEKKLGIDFQVVRYENWAKILNALESREVDISGAITLTPKRSEFLLFTKPHIKVPMVIITRNIVKGELSLDDLNGMRVSVVSGYASHDFLAKDYPEIKLDLVPDVETGLKKVSFGMTDAFIENLGSASYYLEKTEITNLRIAGETGYFYDLALGIRKDWPIFRSILNKALDQIPQEQKQAIFQKWIHLKQRPLISNRRLLIGIAGGIGAFILVLGGVLIWNRSLRAMVRLRTAELRQELSERQRAEAEVRSLNLELEDRVARRTAELKAVNKELESFSYSVSHDLRSPLRSLDGFSQLLLEDYGEQIDSQARDYLQRIRSASQRMAQLIDDMLKLSRISQNEINLASVDLSLLANSIAEEFRASQPDRQVDFIVETGMTATADRNLMGIVLRNLLGNAWKFTGKVHLARIEFGTGVIDDEKVFFVRDNGAGFNMEYANKLFQPFQRLHGVNEFEGTGVGLATVQRVIRRHGGRVWAEAKVNEGATFYFTLP